MINYDKIQSVEVEELAELLWLRDFCAHPLKEGWCMNGACKKCLIEWLESEENPDEDRRLSMTGEESND